MVSRKANSFEFRKNPSIKSCFPETRSTEGSDNKSDHRFPHHFKAHSCDVHDNFGAVISIKDHPLQDSNPFSTINVEPSSSSVVLYNNVLFNNLPTKLDHSNLCPVIGRKLSVLSEWNESYNADTFPNQHSQGISPANAGAEQSQSLKAKHNFVTSTLAQAANPGEMKHTGQNRHVPLYLAALKGDWRTAKVYLRWNPHAVRATITRGLETVLHIAAGARHTLFVKKLVKKMTPDDLALQNKVGNTALCFAAVSGITEIARVLVNKNKTLPLVRGSKGATPLYMAVLLGRRDMVWYLYSVTDDKDLSGEDRVGLLVAAITSNLFELALARDGNGETALHVLSRKPSAFYSGTQLGLRQRFIYSCLQVKLQRDSFMGDDHFAHWITQALSTGKLLLCKSINYLVPDINQVYNIKLRHLQALELVRQLWQQILNLDDAGLKALIRTPRQLLFTAAEFGIVEFITVLIRSHPDLIWKVDEQSRSIFHTAVVHRQEKVFNLIKELGALKDFIALYKDEKNNNMLHLAGKLPHPNRLNTDSGAALQMRRELLWFKEVEKIVQPLYTEMENSEGKTPDCVFVLEHKKLKREGEKWMKETASSCMVVATLIATVMFAAAFTVPGGNNNSTGRPIFLYTRSFIVFVTSDALGLFSSASSILIFLSILTSRYAEEDFLRSLPNKLIMGLATLFISIINMMVAFSATLFLILSHGLEWATIPIIVVASIPVSLFASLQFPLVVDIISHTFTCFGSRSHLLS
ncbi:protein ACCELERATED CELL DEATH 6 isoform X2 [Hevea brasiliensis]|uniref:protein ACCELERATED CELL DEATH 6 isoform X2 n=1 Tax=Hevea brasiliensis TaxID=3981 RepID=UPI0025F799BE|nr:protein ACCELERATED CELL DEATH 6 isoform X2 [Hevea brasiliensis]